MTVTAAEFRTNFGKYLAMLSTEDIFITQDGKTVAKMSNPNISAVDKLSGLLAGQMPDDYDRKKIREDRISYHAADD